MMSTLDLLIFLDGLEHPPPTEAAYTEQTGPEDFEFHKEGHDAAVEAWQNEAERRHEHLTNGYEHGYIRESPEEAILHALAEATVKVEQAEQHRSELLALAIHSVGVSVRRAAEATGLHAKTAEKRANESTSLETVIAFKECELEALRRQVAGE